MWEARPRAEGVVVAMPLLLGCAVRTIYLKAVRVAHPTRNGAVVGGSPSGRKQDEIDKSALP